MPAGIAMTPTFTTGQAAIARSVTAPAGGQDHAGSGAHGRRETGPRSLAVAGEFTVVRACPKIMDLVALCAENVIMLGCGSVMSGHEDMRARRSGMAIK